MPKIGEKGQWDTFDKKGEVILIKISKGTVPAYFAGIFFVRVCQGSLFYVISGETS